MAFDRSKPAHLLALKNEVANDPESVGYAAVAGQTQPALDLLNIETNNPQVADTTPVPFDVFPMIDAIDEIVQSEYNALSTVKKVKVDAIIYAATNDPLATFGSVKQLFKNAFGSTSATWLAVKNDRLRHASRAEKLFGYDTIISRDDWFAARNS